MENRIKHFDFIKHKESSTGAALSVSGEKVRSSYNQRPILNSRAKLTTEPIGRVKATPYRGVGTWPTALTRPAPWSKQPRSSARPAGRALLIIKSENMENTNVLTRAVTERPPARCVCETKQKQPAYDFAVPERGTTGPRPIGEIMEPFQRIIAHRDRNRLMAEFFNRYW